MPVGTMNDVVVVNEFAPEAAMVIGPNWFRPPTVWIALAVTKAVVLNVASVILVKPVTVRVTLLPDTAVVGAVNVGGPITVIAASAVSVGRVAVNRNV